MRDFPRPNGEASIASETPIMPSSVNVAPRSISDSLVVSIYVRSLFFEASRGILCTGLGRTIHRPASAHHAPSVVALLVGRLHHRPCAVISCQTWWTWPRWGSSARLRMDSGYPVFPNRWVFVPKRRLHNGSKTENAGYFSALATPKSEDGVEGSKVRPR